MTPRYDPGVISRQVFTMLVPMAVFGTVITTPLLRRWLPEALERGRAAATPGSTARGAA